MTIKFQYAGQILLVIVLASTKLSMIMFFKGLTRFKRVILACNGLLVLVVGWTIFSVLAEALQCGFPHAWIYTPQKCAGQVWQLVSQIKTEKTTLLLRVLLCILLL